MKTTMSQVFKAFDNVPMELPEALLNAQHCVSDDATRYSLCEPVARKVNDETIEIIATNGHLLSSRHVRVGELAKELKEDVKYRLVDGSKEALKLMVKKGATFESETGLNFFTIKRTDNGMAVRLESDSTYPDTDSVYPRNLNPETTITVGFQPEYLVDLLKAMRESKGDSMIYLSFDYSKAHKGEYLNPMPVQVGKEKLGLIMPCLKREKQ